jgi:hypothetical protein
MRADGRVRSDAFHRATARLGAEAFEIGTHEQDFVEARAVADQLAAGIERERRHLRAARLDIRDRDDFTLARAVGKYQLVTWLRACAAQIDALGNCIRRQVQPQHHA